MAHKTVLYNLPVSIWFARPLINNQGCIQNPGCRAKACVKRGQIYKRFERRPRLAHRLCCPVKFRLGMIIATSHRQQPPGMRIHRNDGAFGRRALPQRKIILFGTTRF